jgi:hypothetical protein
VFIFSHFLWLFVFMFNHFLCSLSFLLFTFCIHFPSLSLTPYFFAFTFTHFRSPVKSSSLVFHHPYLLSQSRINSGNLPRRGDSHFLHQLSTYVRLLNGFWSPPGRLWSN